MPDALLLRTLGQIVVTAIADRPLPTPSRSTSSTRTSAPSSGSRSTARTSRSQFRVKPDEGKRGRRCALLGWGPQKSLGSAPLFPSLQCSSQSCRMSVETLKEGKREVVDVLHIVFVQVAVVCSIIALVFHRSR